MVKIQICKNVVHFNYKKLISPATYCQAVLPVPFTWCRQNIQQHLMCKGQGCCLTQLQGAAFRLYRVEGAPVHQGMTFTKHNLDSTGGPFVTRLSSAVLSPPGVPHREKGRQVTGSSSAITSQTRGGKPKSNLGNFSNYRNGSNLITTNHYLKLN